MAALAYARCDMRVAGEVFCGRLVHVPDVPQTGQQTRGCEALSLENRVGSRLPQAPDREGPDARAGAGSASSPPEWAVSLSPTRGTVRRTLPALGGLRELFP